MERTFARNRSNYQGLTLCCSFVVPLLFLCCSFVVLFAVLSPHPGTLLP